MKRVKLKGKEVMWAAAKACEGCRPVTVGYLRLREQHPVGSSVCSGLLTGVQALGTCP